MEEYLLCTELYDESNNFGQKAIFLEKYLWNKNTTITIKFLENGDDIERKQINNDQKNVDPLQFQIQNSSLKPPEIVKLVVQERIQPLINLKLNFVDDSNDANIRISFDKTKGSWSTNGTDALKIVDKNKATMNFGWLDVRTILHEFGHVLGMGHEHQGPFSNIQWNKPLLYRVYNDSLGWDKKKVNRQIINRYNYKDSIGSYFDPLSIMIYFFPAKLTLNNLGTPENNRLSGYDVLWITKTYSKDQSEDGYISPEDFYLQTYGITLDEALKESDKESDKYSKPSVWWWKILIAIIVFMIFAALIFKFYKSRKQQSYHRIDRGIKLSSVKYKI